VEAITGHGIRQPISRFAFGGVESRQLWKKPSSSVSPVVLFLLDHTPLAVSQRRAKLGFAGQELAFLGKSRSLS